VTEFVSLSGPSNGIKRRDNLDQVRNMLLAYNEGLRYMPLVSPTWRQDPATRIKFRDSDMG